MAEGPRVLIADDDPSVRRLFVRVLERADFTTSQASNGRQTLEAIAADQPAAVLLDCRMPEPGGLEVLRALRSDPATRTLPVILVTGQADVHDRVAGLEAGANDYVNKPVHPDELVARVRAQIRGGHAWREVVEQSWRERASVVENLARVATDADIDDPAAAVCQIVTELSGISGCAVLELSNQRATTLSRSGGIAWEPGRALPDRAAHQIIRRSREGPWSWEESTEPADRRITTAFGPIVRDGVIVGVLVLASEASTSGPVPVGQTLATAIDLSPAVGEILATRLSGGIDLVATRAALSDIIEHRRFHPVFQPIVRIADGTHIGFEALTRFDDDRPPARWFSDAVTVGAGLDLDLEVATLRAAFAHASALPDDAFLSVNASARLILETERLHSALREAPDRTIVLEITEREPVHDYAAVRQALESFPGVHIAVDDAGAGYASLRHILALEPLFIKLDQTWVRGLEEDAARQALVAGLVHFANVTGGEIIAEGVETEAECGAVAAVGATLAQGYYFGKPDLAEAWV
jgi:EAL domain-containing protein (putative c-di-GMP-specific phosphodiesterase class I)/CheY-like chemotaxis protein